MENNANLQGGQTVAAPNAQVYEKKPGKWGSLTDDRILESLENQYRGNGYKVTTTLTPDDDTDMELNFIFKKPTTASYDRYVKMTATSSTKALKTFIRDNVVEEQKGDLDDVTEQYPAISISAGEKLLYILGLSKDATVKKL